MLKSFSIILISLVLASCAQKPPSSTVTLLDGYRTRGAAHAMLGSYGRKTGKVQFGYERVDVPKWKSVALKKVAVVDITEEKKRELENAGVSFATAGQVTASASSSENASYKIVFMEVLSLAALRNELRELIKKDPDVKKDLIDKNARIVITSGVVLDHETARQVSAGLDANASLANVSGSPVIKLKGSASSTKTLKIGDQTVVAYQYARLCWEHGELRALVRDSTSADLSACPNGSSRTFPG